MMVKEMAAIVAVATQSRGIGYRGDMPWSLPGDLKHFQKITMGDTTDKKNAVIMGRKTWESIPKRFRPLKGRTNIILTRKETPSEELVGTSNNGSDAVLVANSFQDACRQLDAQSQATGDIFVIGGSEVYQKAITEGLVKKIYYTKIWNLKGERGGNGDDDDGVKFDSFFPILPPEEWEEQRYTKEGAAASASDDKENSGQNNKNTAPQQPPQYFTDPKSGVCYDFWVYNRKQKKTPPNVEELQYLDMCRDILDHGIQRGDRTGTGTLSKFGTQMRFSLRDGTLPLLTTKRTFWRGVAEELLWFISGNTNANDLADKNIHIWDGNGSREFLDSRGLTERAVGDLGPVYGFQWRHFGAKYVDMNTDYTGQGVDQLADCIRKIKENPTDRRILMSAWNPADLEEMALPPCHMFCQFYVDVDKNELSCQMYQRSADMGLGVPFNIASYSLLTHLIAHVTGRKPGEFIHTIGDAHVYLNHVDALKEQLTRTPRPFPKLVIHNNDDRKKTIDDFVYDDLEIVGYNPHKTIKMKMAV